MRLTLLSVLLATTTAPLAVSAGGQLGFSLGNLKSDGKCKLKADYELDFDALKGHTSLVRTYTSAGCNTAEQILPAAAGKEMSVVLGVWPDVDDDYNKDKAALQSALSDPANAKAVYAITVGSEALYRNTLTEDKLLEKIQDMKRTFPNKKVGFAEVWQPIRDRRADKIIKAGVDLILANAFSYWQGQDIKNATHSYLDDLTQVFTHIQTTAGTTDIEIWNGETGWPGDGGDDFNAAKAGTDNAKTFFQTGVCSALNWGYNVFYFEAFDEAGKPNSKGDNGKFADEKHWGAMTADRTVKFDMAC